MSEREIFCFRCGTTALLALTGNRDGLDLPKLSCPGGWRFERSFNLNLAKSSPKQELAQATVQAIDAHGFYLVHTAFHVLPIEILPPVHNCPPLQPDDNLELNHRKTVRKQPQSRRA
jgi:hypothetical protein